MVADAVLLFVGLFLLYFVPTFAASGRGAHHTAGIFVLNLFLGWTVLVWIAALIWAVSSPAKPAAPRRPANAPEGPKPCPADSPPGAEPAGVWALGAVAEPVEDGDSAGAGVSPEGVSAAPTGGSAMEGWRSSTPAIATIAVVCGLGWLVWADAFPMERESGGVGNAGPAGGRERLAAAGGSRPPSAPPPADNVAPPPPSNRRVVPRNIPGPTSRARSAGTALDPSPGRCRGMGPLNTESIGQFSRRLRNRGFSEAEIAEAVHTQCLMGYERAFLNCVVLSTDETACDCMGAAANFARVMAREPRMSRTRRGYLDGARDILAVCD